MSVPNFNKIVKGQIIQNLLLTQTLRNLANTKPQERGVAVICKELSKY